MTEASSSEMEQWSITFPELAGEMPFICSVQIIPKEPVLLYELKKNG